MSNPLDPSLIDSSAMPLGKNVSYARHYDPSLLFPIPRAPKRIELGIIGSPPFMGVDIWNAYEVSWLNMRGKPQIAIVQCVIPADSPYLVESKSFKLYLNTLNHTPLASAADVVAMLRRDLTAVCQADVQISLYAPEAFASLSMAELSGLLLDRLDIVCTHYQPDARLLGVDKNQTPVEESLVSHLLKSNCLVTGQPDWASIQIYYRGLPIQQEGLLQYLVSFRDHNGFHEQCVEHIFMDILRQCQPEKLAVYARYTRRGGLDINPYRCNFTGAWPKNQRTARQ
ncbi:MAG: NADPH-dependent 7-cyano-7-deazaguanine reductase QueF [Ottowia sp.]|nr:NADPH-dependent 7-cyano-7-deazaguanine reductase QueF [Ottowia sp.]